VPRGDYGGVQTETGSLTPEKLDGDYSGSASGDEQGGSLLVNGLVINRMVAAALDIWTCTKTTI